MMEMIWPKIAVQRRRTEAETSEHFATSTSISPLAMQAVTARKTPR